MNRRMLLFGLFAVGCGRSNGEEASAKASPWPRDRLLAPADLARRLPPANDSPTVIHVGPVTLFHSGHVPGAWSVGETGATEGLAELERRSAASPRDLEIVIYCGCCPWKNCPNIRPSYEKLAQMRFTNVRVLDLPTTFRAGWSEKGLPVERSS